jgi:hypothetical protein
MPAFGRKTSISKMMTTFSAGFLYLTAVNVIDLGKHFCTQKSVSGETPVVKTAGFFRYFSGTGGT